jgi:hypothetical protein
MRKLGISAIVIGALLLPACGSDNKDDTRAQPDKTSTATQTGPAEDEEYENNGQGEDEDKPGGEQSEGTTDDASGAAIDMSAALLTAKDLPAGAEIKSLDLAQITNEIQDAAANADDLTYDPASCAGESANPFGANKIEAKALQATIAATQDVLVNAVVAHPKSDALSKLENYIDTCGEVSVSGNIAGQPVNLVVTTTAVPAPDLDADKVVAWDAATSSNGGEAVPIRTIFMVDGDYGVYVSGMPDSTSFKLEDLAATALDRLHAAEES